jgi:uncharacterized protein (DUF924 family)
MTIVSLPDEEINELWFGGLHFDMEKPFPMEGIQRWFRQTDEFDNKCKSVSPQSFTDSRPYESLVREVAELPAPSLFALASSPEKSLTLILLLDQISRNIMRGQSAEWVYKHCDPTALHVVHHCLRQGFDQQLPVHKRIWYYSALSHNETFVDQETSLAKTATLACEVRTKWPEWHHVYKLFLDYAIKFYTTIDKFGRFPHRNPVLNRESTEEEKVFLAAALG